MSIMNARMGFGRTQKSGRAYVFANFPCSFCYFSMQFLLLFHSRKKHVYAKVLQKKHIALTVSFQNRGGIEKRKPQ